MDAEKLDMDVNGLGQSAQRVAGYDKKRNIAKDDGQVWRFVARHHDWNLPQIRKPVKLHER